MYLSTKGTLHFVTLFVVLSVKPTVHACYSYWLLGVSTIGFDNWNQLLLLQALEKLEQKESEKSFLSYQVLVCSGIKA